MSLYLTRRTERVDLGQVTGDHATRCQAQRHGRFQASSPSAPVPPDMDLCSDVSYLGHAWDGWIQMSVTALARHKHAALAWTTAQCAGETMYIEKSGLLRLSARLLKEHALKMAAGCRFVERQTYAVQKRTCCRPRSLPFRNKLEIISSHAVKIVVSNLSS